MIAIINLVHFPTFISQLPQNKLCGDIFIVIPLLNLDSHLEIWQIFIRKCLKNRWSFQRMISSAYLNYNRQNLVFFFAFVSNDVLLFIGSIIDLQYCVSFRCTTKRFSCLNQIVFHYRLLQDTEYSSLYYTWGGFPGVSVVKNPPANEGNAGDTGSITGLGR